MRNRLESACVGVLAAVAAGLMILSPLGAQTATRMFGTLSANLGTGTGTPITCTASGSGCYLDVSVAGGGSFVPVGVAAGSVLISNGVGVAPLYSANPTVTTLNLGVAGVADVILARDAANTLAQRNGAAAQTLNLGVTNATSAFALTSVADGVGQLSNFAKTGFTRLILGTNDAVVTTGASLRLVNSELEAWTGDATALTAFRASALSVTSGNWNTNSNGKTTTYNGLATDGWGVVAVQGGPSQRKVGATNAQTIGSYTVGAADGSFEVSANINVTTSTTYNFTVTCVYTDEGNTSRTLTFGFTQLSGATFITAITNITGAGPYESPVYAIRAKAGTTITIATAAGGTYTAVAYNGEGPIKQIS